MSSGARAAENTKAFFGQFTHDAEDFRQSINSYFDGIKSNTHSNTADNTRDPNHQSTSRGFFHHNDQSTTTTTTDDDVSPSEQTTGRTGSTHTAGFSKDSQRAGEKFKEGANSLERKFREKQARRH